MQTRNGRSPLKGKINGKIDQIRIKKNKKRQEKERARKKEKKS